MVVFGYLSKGIHIIRISEYFIELKKVEVKQSFCNSWMFIRSLTFREHAMLVKTAGVKHMVVLINKMDDPTVGWDKARYETIHLVPL